MRNLALFLIGCVLALAVVTFGYSSRQKREAAEAKQLALAAMELRDQKRFRYDADKPYFLDLPDGRKQPVKSLLNVKHMMRFGSYVWDDKGIADGVFRKGIDPIELHMSISALCFYNVSNRYTFNANFGVDMGAPKAMKKRRDQVAEIILAWVKQ